MNNWNNFSPAFRNTSITKLDLENAQIQGQRGGDVLRDLLDGNKTLMNLRLTNNPIGPEGAIGLGLSLATGNSTRLQSLNLCGYNISNNGVANLVPAADGDGKINNSLMRLNLGENNIGGAQGGHYITLLLQHFSVLKALNLSSNEEIGPLGASALAPGLAAATRLEELYHYGCGLGSVGVSDLIPVGQENKSLTRLDLYMNDIQAGPVGGESVIALASRFTNLDCLDIHANSIHPDQRRRLDSLLDRKRLVTEAQSLGDAPFSLVFEKLVHANDHEHGLSAMLVILRD